MTRRQPIRVMPPELARKIAAGEVVERPASAVKELLDNALDAGARRITIEVREAGLRLIRVSDDGCGIPRDELSLAFVSHATSKIADLDDLEHLETLGFRGEALFSIAAVARVEVQTRTSSEEVGTRLRVEFGHVVREEPAASSLGTRITVEDLFSNVPARRRFVRSMRSEAGQIQQVVGHYALARPDVRFNLLLDDRSVFLSPGNGRLLHALAAVYGTGAAESVFPIDERLDGVGVEGVASFPTLTRPNRTGIHVFVNSRPVQNRTLAFALEEAYSGYLMTGRHPLAVVHLSLDPEEVDANIHPSKAEVRLARDREVHRALHRAVANALTNSRNASGFPDIDPEATAAPGTFHAELPLPVGETSPPTSKQTNWMPALPVLRVFGQTNQAFIVAEGPDGLYMIDQHAAHERVLFDQLDKQLTESAVASQPLLEAELIEVEPPQMRALEENQDLLKEAGFVLEPFGGGACLIRSIPALTSHEGPVDVVREVLTELENLPVAEAARERALAAMACKAAVKAGQTLDVQEMRDLVAKLERTARPSTCPHGRPTMIHVSHTQLEREFGRR